MKFEVSHRTTYAYRLPVVQSHHLIHLEPRTLPRQKILLHSLLIDPAPVARTDLEDSFGNAAVLLRIEDEHSEFIVHSRSTVELTAPPTPNLDSSTPWEQVAQMLTRPGTDLEAVQFACRSRHAPQTAGLRAFALPFFPPGRPVFAGAMDLTTKIFQTFTFDPTASDVSTPVSQVLQQRRGVCQDFAHLAIASLRSLGLSARYVSGYLLTRPPPGQPRLKGADSSHAWMSVWDPKLGWVDYDPTNGLIPSREHITVAYGRDYEDISPISGVLLGGGDQTMTVAVDVELQAA